MGEIEEQKGLTSVPKTCDRVVVCRAVHLSVQRVNCWIAFQKASQINPAVWRFGSSRSSVVGQTGALTNEPWSFWASPFSGVEQAHWMSLLCLSPPHMFELMSEMSREELLLLIDTGRL